MRPARPWQGVLDHDGIEAALAASSVGTWDWDIAADRTRICLITASLFGFSATDVTRGPSLEDYRKAIHPDDRPLFDRTVSDVRRTGGLFVAEYRTRPAPGRERWALARGTFEADETGAISRARGIVIDVTDTRMDGFGAGRAMFSVASEPGGGLDRFADLALDAWRNLQGLTVADQEKLGPIMEQLLVAVGRRLAKQERSAEPIPGRLLPLHS